MPPRRTVDPGIPDNENRTTNKSMIIGIFFLVLGLSILLKILFKIDLPVFRAIFSLFLIYLGVRMLTGTFGMSGLFEWKDRSSIVFSEGRFRADKEAAKGEQTHYSIVFGKGVVDLTDLTPANAPHDIEVNVVFGEAIILLDPSTPVHVVSNAVFGEARMPDENQVVFGTLNYRTPGATEAMDSVIHVHTNVVFGSVRIRTKTSVSPSSPLSGTGKPGPSGKAADKENREEEEKEE